MWDFSKLLGSLAGEDAAGFLSGVTDPSAKKRMPPKTELTPSESAGQEIVAGMHEAATPPTPVAGHGMAGGLKAVGNALSSIKTPDFIPVAPTQIYNQPVITPYQATQVPRFATGGYLQHGVNIVGENGPEIAVKDGDKTKIVPITSGQHDQPIATDAQVTDNVQNRPMSYVPQSPSDIQRGHPGTQSVVVAPQTTMGVNDNIVMPQEQPVQQEQRAVDPLQNLYQQKQDLNAQPIKKQPFWKDFGTNLLLGANAFFNPQQGPTPLVGWGAVKRQNENAALDRQIKPLEAIKTEQDKEAYNKARIDNIYADNATAQQKLLDAKDALKTRQQGMAVGRLAKMQYFDPKNAIHAKLAKEAGLDPAELEGFDWRKPTLKTVAGTTYQWKDGEFVPSGLPADESLALTDYNVQMPTGEVQTFKVPQKDAARFATQMQVLGAQIQAADRRQDKSIAAQRETQGMINTRQEKQQAFQMQLQKDRQAYGDQEAESRARLALKKANPDLTEAEITQWLHPAKPVDPNAYELNPDGFVMQQKP